MKIILLGAGQVGDTQAKRMGAKKLPTLINNRAYVDLAQGGEIDIAISPSRPPSAAC